MVTFFGGSGTLSGMALTEVDGFDQPTSFFALTVNEYSLPLVSPVIWQVVTRRTTCCRRPQSTSVVG